MVKTLPTVERSTKIRFGRHAQEDQGENSIVLNASNTAVDATEGGAVYITPVRFDDTYTEKTEIVLMMYNRNTKEMVESGEPASTLISDVSLQNSTTQGNVTSNSMIFYNNAVAFVTSGNVGISNALASHTLSVGSNLYVDDYGTNVLVVSGGVGITDTTTSTSATTGALKVAGGISTEENLNVGAVTKVLSATDSTSKTTGSLIVTGGVGISKNIHGKNVFVEDVVSNSVVILDTTTSSSATTGALKVVGGISTQENLNVGGTTTSTSATTGALQVAGGISTQENLNVGAVAKVLSATDASSKTTGALIVTGGVGISKNIHALNANFEDVEADSVDITDTTLSYNQTTGALKVAGGLGVAGNVHCGNLTLTGNLVVTGNTTVINANNLVVQDPIIELGKGNTSGLDTGILMNNPLTSGNKGNVAVIYDFSTSNLEIGHTLSSANNSPVIMNTSNAIAVNINGTLGVTSTTASSSKTTGAVTIGGGLGVVGDIHATHVNFEDVEADSVTITDNTTSTSATTGALKVVGGISTQENLSVGGDVLVVDTTAGSAAGPEVELFRNITGADGNYLGQVKFQGNNDADAQKNYAKITGKISDASDGTEDGLIEFATIKAGSQSIRARLTSTNLKLLNDAGIEVDGTADITNSTGSTSTTTGALKVAGGISTQEKLNVGGITKIWDATDASSKTTGALIVTGGVGISKNIHALHANFEDVEADSVNITDTTTSTNATTGALKVAGGISTQKNLNVGSNAHISSNLEVGTANLFVNTLTSNVGIGTKTPGELLDIAAVSGDHDAFIRLRSGSGGSPVTESGIKLTESSRFGWRIAQNANTNSLKIAHQDQNDAINGDNYMVFKSGGNIGIAEADPTSKLQVAGDVNITDTTDASSKTTGALIVAGGVGISKNIHALHANFEDVEADSVTVTDTTESKLRTNGALIVAGGIGVASNVNTTNLHALGTTSTLSKTTGTVIVAGGVGVSGNIHALHANFEDVEADSVTITDTTTSDSATTGALKVAGGISTQENLNVGAVAKVISATDASSKTTGALIVTGGVGISKNIHALHANFEDVEADSVTVTDTTTSTSATTGALKVAGGISTQENLNVGAVAKVISATDASSKTTGALIVTGGVGISKNIHALHANFEDVEADSVNITDTTVSSSKTTGALIVAGGLGVAANIHTSNIYAGYDADETSYLGRAAVGFAGETNHASFAHVDNNTSGNYALKQTEGGTTHVNAKAGQHIRLNINNSEKARITGAGDLKIGSNVLYVDVSETSIGVNTASPEAKLHVEGNAYVSSNLTVDTNTLHVDAANNRVGILNKNPAYALDVDGDINFTGTFREDGNPFVSTPWTIETSPDALSYTAGNVGIGAADPEANLHVTGNAFVSSTTDATTTVTGALIVAGGMGIAKKIVGQHANFEDVEADSVTVTDTTTSSSKTTGSLIVAGGVGVSGNIHALHTNFEDVEADSVTITDTTEATSSTTGALKAAGGVGIAKDVYVGERAYVTGGLITNTGGVGKKTYSYSADLGNDASIGNATYILDFTNHPFHAKVTAMLIESDDEISTMIFDVIGGKLGGGSNSAYVPALGQVSVINTSTMNTRWDHAVATALAGTTVTIKPADACSGVVRFNIFVEYLSHETAGQLESITNSGTSAGSGAFGY